MLTSQYEQSMKEKNFFLLRNEIFDLELNLYELGIQFIPAEDGQSA